MKILLKDWGSKNYNPSPSLTTLLGWRKSGQFCPPPEKVGRHWMIEEHAARIPLPEMNDLSNISKRALTILKAT